jgi:hypothetical protein
MWDAAKRIISRSTWGNVKAAPGLNGLAKRDRVKARNRRIPANRLLVHASSPLIKN